MSNRPLCKCHGEPMLWKKDKRCAGGGWWKCKTKHNEYARSLYRRRYGVDSEFTEKIRRKGREGMRRRSAQIPGYTERNRYRVGVCGTKISIPRDPALLELARRLRDERKEQRGNT